MTAPRDPHLIFSATLGVALVGVIDDAFSRGDVALAERLLLGLLHKLPARAADACPPAALYLSKALQHVRDDLRASCGGGREFLS